MNSTMPEVLMTMTVKMTPLIMLPGGTLKNEQLVSVFGSQHLPFEHSRSWKSSNGGIVRLPEFQKKPGTLLRLPDITAATLIIHGLPSTHRIVPLVP
jgi:hypothetical protein